MRGSSCPFICSTLASTSSTGGAICTVSRRAQDHRSGWAWDKLLDVIEKFDRDHGALSGLRCGVERVRKWTQVLVTGFWVVVIWKENLTAQSGGQVTDDPTLDLTGSTDAQANNVVGCYRRIIDQGGTDKATGGTIW